MSSNRRQDEVRWLLTALFFIFLILKLSGQIEWPWWQVTAPVWAPLALSTALLFAVWCSEKIERRARHRKWSRR